MKFICQQCQTKYSIGDERVHGRVLKVRCKTCSAVITVREEQPAPVSLGPELAKAALTAEKTIVSSVPAGVAEAEEWFVSFEGAQQGPFTVQQAVERIVEESARGRAGHVWRAGFFTWLAAEDVPEFDAALKANRAARPAPPRGNGAAAGKVPDRARATTGWSPRLPGVAPVVGEGSPAEHGAMRLRALADEPEETRPTAVVTPRAQPQPPSPAAASSADGELLIGDASGLINLAHLAPLAERARRAGTAAAGVRRAPPVVLIPGLQRDHAPWMRWAALGGLLGTLTLAAVIGVLLAPPSWWRSSAADGRDVSERTLEDSPIALNDGRPMGVPLAADPKRVPPSRRVSGRPAASALAPPPAVAKIAPELSGAQKNLALLYGEGADFRREALASHDVPASEQRRGAAQISDNDLRGVVTKNNRSLHLCYDRVLRHDPTLKRARILVQVKIGLSGNVVAANVPKEYAATEIGTCLVDTVKRWHFPPADAEYQTEFPLLLQAQ